MANFRSNDVSVLLGNGDGTFRPAQNVGTVASFLDSVAVGDFNGDGKLDLVVANSPYISVLLGNGDGTFRAPLAVRFDIGGALVVGDFNVDGKLDLAVANFSDNNVALLLGNGDASFQVPRYFGDDAGPWSATIGDFNADGKPDLAVANVVSNGVSVLINTTLFAPVPGIGQLQQRTVLPFTYSNCNSTLF